MAKIQLEELVKNLDAELVLDVVASKLFKDPGTDSFVSNTVEMGRESLGTVFSSPAFPALVMMVNV